MSTKITYNGRTTEVADGYIATLPCKDYKMETDVVVEAPEGSGVAIAEWNGSIAYNPDAIVIFEEIYYVCIKATTAGSVVNNPSVTPSEWQKLNGAYKGEYDSSETYYKGDIVVSGGNLYQSKIDSPETSPDNDMASRWTLLHEGGGGGATPTQEKSVTITENGTTEVLPDDGYALSKVTINANVKQNFCVVRFYNDDRTTLLYETVVPYGSSAIYAGNAPTSSLGEDYAFTGFEPSTASVTADTDCYAVYEETAAEIGTLGNTNWATISSISEAGTAANYFAVGDAKAVALKGTVGTLELDTTLCAYIIGLNHNGGTGITFGTFKTADTNGIEVALAVAESGYPNAVDGTKLFNYNHWGSFNYGGWKGSDLRYDILGSTDKAPSGYGSAKITTTVGYDASTTCATNPVANTLIAALPVDLRVVMKPMTIYTDNTGNTSNIEANVTASIDYLPLLAEYEVFGARYSANQHEQNKQAQYAYYAAGNSPLKYRHSATGTVIGWALRSPAIMSASGHCTVTAGGAKGTTTAHTTYGLSPIFKV